MKREMEVVRDVLQQISDAAEKPSSGTLVKGKTEEEAKRILYHIELLSSAGFLTGISSKPPKSDYASWRNLDLTWTGHEFVDTTRSPEVWDKTKEGMKKVGSWSVNLVLDMAKAYAKHIASEKLGLNFS